MATYLYILRCAENSYYVGTTRTDLETRVAQHNAGTFGGYTARRRPVVLIRGDFEALRNLAWGWTKSRQ